MEQNLVSRTYELLLHWNSNTKHFAYYYVCNSSRKLLLKSHKIDPGFCVYHCKYQDYHVMPGSSHIINIYHQT